MSIERWIYTLPLRLRSIFRREQVEHEMDEELRYHLESQIELHMSHGLSPEAARRAAQRSLGKLERHRDEIRDTRRVEWVSALIQDARHGGAVIGLVIAAASVRVLETLVYGVQPLDVPSFALATVVLLVVGTVACWMPALRASKADPNMALRSE